MENKQIKYISFILIILISIITFSGCSSLLTDSNNEVTQSDNKDSSVSVATDSSQTYRGENSIQTITNGTTNDNENNDIKINNSNTMIEPKSTLAHTVFANTSFPIDCKIETHILDVGERGYVGVRTPGDIISYVVFVTNTGNVTLHNLLAVDSAHLTSNCGLTKTSLLPKETWKLYGDYEVSVSDMVAEDAIIGITSISCDEFGTRTTTRTIPLDCKYIAYQPVASEEEYKYINDDTYSDLSYFVGADNHRITLLVNTSARNPTFQELIDFIKADKTNEIPYDTSSFVCGDYAEIVQNNAEMAGYKCAWVSIDFENEKATVDTTNNIVKIGHACNLFRTTDQGLVGVDCVRGTCNSTNNVNLDMWDSRVTLVKGGQYVPELLYSFNGSDRISTKSIGTIAAYFPFRNGENDI